jgi:hypothetical protein
MRTQLLILGALMFTAGATLLSIAAWMVYPPAMFALDGLLCLGAASVAVGEARKEAR